MDISKSIVANTTVLDATARAALPSSVSGVSVNSVSIIHLLDDSQANQYTANAVLDAYGTLTVTADKTTLTEGGADPVITCNDALIAGDAEVGYVVLLDGEVYATGTDTVTSGVSELTLASPVAGKYEVFVYRISGNYASGSVNIIVSEV